MPKQRQLTRHKQPPKQSIPAITLLLDSSFRHITFTINRTSTLKAPSVWLITVLLLMINKERKIKYVRVCECLCKYGLCYHISCKFAVKKKALKRRSADGKWLTHSERLDEVDERVTAVAARASSQQPLSKAETLWVTLQHAACHRSCPLRVCAASSPGSSVCRASSGANLTWSARVYGSWRWRGCGGVQLSGSVLAVRSASAGESVGRWKRRGAAVTAHSQVPPGFLQFSVFLLGGRRLLFYMSAAAVHKQQSLSIGYWLS